jgi:hypothetical protein
MGLAQEKGITTYFFARTTQAALLRGQRALGTLIQRTGADEIIATAQIFDHAARLHSFEIVAEIFETPNSPSLLG